MADAAGENILKVLSGNQFGVEVTLGDGVYSFGSGDEADIRLLDLSLQPLHGQVRLRDGKIEIRAMQGDISTASGLSVTRDDDTWHEIAQMDAISAGLSKFVIAGSGADWSALVPAATPAKPRGPALGLTGQGLAAIPRRVLYGAGGAVALLALLAILGGNGGDAAQRGTTGSTEAAVAALRQAIADKPFASQVTVTERADGTLAIEGYVEDQVERRAIQNSIDESALPAVLRVYVRENLRADIAGTIESMKVPATFTLDDAGNVTLSGTILDPAAAAKLEENIRTGVFGLASVKNDIRTADQILSDLRGIARDAGLGDLVIFRLDGLVVEATGIVPRDKMDNWVGLIGVYSRRFAAEIPLRSFVTLDQPAASDTAPVIIGSGPVAEAETGRVVSPETLAEPNEVDARSLFAGQPPTADGTQAAAPAAPQGTAPAAPLASAPLASAPLASAPLASAPLQIAQAPAALAPAAQTQPPAPATAAAATAPAPAAPLVQAFQRLQAERPDLADQLTTAIQSGTPPDTALMQQILAALGGRMQSTDSGTDGTRQVEVILPGIGSLGRLDGLVTQLGDVIRQAQQPPAPAQVATTPIAATPPAAGQMQTATPTETPAATPTQTPAEAVASAPAVAADAPLAPAAPAMAEAAPAPAAEAEDPQQLTAQGLPYFALPKSEPAGLDRLVAAADSVIGASTAGGAAQSNLSPNLLSLVAMQHEQLQMGRTLMRLPRPLSALPYPVEEAITCWPGGKLTPEMLPAALLLLDSLSLSSENDITKIDPDLRDIMMETALSPDRVRACLDRTRSNFGQMVGNSSTFLSETARNPDFVEFLFRNAQRAELPLAGASLQGTRYIELQDGRKLREGAAPDITSRIMAIGDLGILVRTADGTRVQLFGENLGWRVVDACTTADCGAN